MSRKTPSADLQNALLTAFRSDSTDACDSAAILKFWEQVQFEYSCSYETSSPIPAIMGLVPDADGRYPVDAMDKTGKALRGHIRYHDSQTVDCQEVAGIETVTQRPSSEIIRDSLASTSDRIKALCQTIFSDPESTADFLIEELKKNVPWSSWLDAIIRAVEVVRFDDLQRQHDVGRTLLQLALSLKDERRSEVAHTIYCAIHRGGSLIPVGEVTLFEPFLENRGGVDTRLAALQAIVHIFEVEKDVPRSAYESILQRIDQLTSKYLDPDVLMPGDVGAIALEGMVALHLLDCETFKRKENNRSPAPKWFDRLLKRRIRELTISQPSNVV